MAWKKDQQDLTLIDDLSSNIRNTAVYIYIKEKQAMDIFK